MGFYEVFKVTALFEGGYTNDPGDKGGPTNHGITEAVARANGYTGLMQDLSTAEAERIAKVQYWDVLRGDDIDALSPKIMEELFDTGYNCGTGTAAKFLQRALNVLNHEGKDYSDVTVDGVIGPMTVYALKQFLAKRKQEGELVLLRVMNSLQGAYYVDITEKNQQDEEFTYGWFLNRIQL